MIPPAPPGPGSPEPPDPLVPVFDTAPAFEEELGPRPRAAGALREFLDGGSEPGRICQVLGRRLRALGRDKRLRRIGVAAPGHGDGSTTVALGLAAAMARDLGTAARVLLVELDLVRPGVDRVLGLEPPAAGLRRFLEGTADVPVLRRCSASGFWLLSAGTGTAVPAGALASPRLLALLRATERVFDYVVADCPPLVGSREIGALQDRLDGLVCVVRSRRTTRDAVLRAASLLRPERLLGVVLNAQRDILPRRA